LKRLKNSSILSLLENATPDLKNIIGGDFFLSGELHYQGLNIGGIWGEFFTPTT
jgi:hypothetical protein